MKVRSKPIEYNAELIDGNIEDYINDGDYKVITQCEIGDCEEKESFNYELCKNCRYCECYLWSHKIKRWVSIGQYIVYNNNESFVFWTQEEFLKRFEVINDEN